MAFRLAKKGNGRPRPAYLPLFAMMRPTAYAKWNRPRDERQVRPFLR
jgi:hypothetical protein